MHWDTEGVLDGISILPVRGVPEIQSGDVLASILLDHAELRQNDVVVVTQKVVSKAEGQVVQIGSSEADKMALVQRESMRILRQRGSLLITETVHGFVCANAGVDLSNVDKGTASLLPKDSDRSARRIRDGISARGGLRVGIVVSDTFGRPWRRGVTDVAIGVAGIAGIIDLKGFRDGNGRTLNVTEVCIADELAAAADLVMGKSKRIPFAIIRNIDHGWLQEASVATDVVRSPQDDLFR